MPQFMKINNPNAKSNTRPMFGPRVSKFIDPEVALEEEIIEGDIDDEIEEELPVVSPEVAEEVAAVEEKPEFVCEVCGMVAKSKIGLIGHSRVHK